MPLERKRLQGRGGRRSGRREKRGAAFADRPGDGRRGIEIGIAEPEGNRISEATAKVVMPNAVYRAWREANIGG